MGIILMHVRDGLAQNEPNGRDIDHCDYNDDVMGTDGKCVVDLKTGGDEMLKPVLKWKSSWYSQKLKEMKWETS